MSQRTVVPVGTDRTLVRAWVSVPRRSRAGDPTWVPPLKSDARAALDRSANPLYRHAAIEHFVLLEGRKPVGRVAATVYPAYNRKFGGHTGFFGFLDTPEGDGEAARLLLSHAEQWLAEQGMTRILGPYNYYSGQEMGLLVEGFDGPPAAFQPGGRPSDRELVEKAGYRYAFGMNTYCLEAGHLRRLAPAVIGAGQRAAEQLGVTVRRMDRAALDAELELVRNLFNRSFHDNSEIVPYPQDVFAGIVGQLKPFLDERLVSFIEWEGRTVGFVLSLPDLNELLLRLNGSLRPWDLLRIRSLVRRTRGMVVLLAGVLPEVPMGISPVLFGQILQGAVDGGYERVHTTWVHDSNRTMNRLIQHTAGLRPHRRYAMFEKELAAP
ncbi:hypothetical protein FOF52_21585 [Thermobifida alba]|uniref:N-acetyltransferase domain-containing protein n=1 Tax=Thermobifida alba TaxID=53522 RepID=A0ABY4L6E0_THEAE|nr:hypothetical protein [Thermobifida alba]UPT23216.1 hypothetical protein FOF52_21585 [Thermobifida alba]